MLALVLLVLVLRSIRAVAIVDAQQCPGFCGSGWVFIVVLIVRMYE